MKRLHTISLLSGALLVIAALPACQTSQRAVDQGDAAFADGNFRVALGWYQEAENRGEVGQDIETRLLNARLATATERGRSLYLEGFLEEALGVFRAASSLRPSDQRIRDWALKVRRDLSTELMLRARELAYDESDYAMAEALLLQADELWAGDPEVISSLQEVRELADWDRRKAQYYYEQGNRDLDANEIRVARWNYERTREYDDGHEGAGRRLVQLDEPILDLRMRVAERLIESRRWHAAAAALRNVLETNPGYARAEELRDAMENEADAADLLEEARRLISRKELAEASRSLERGRLLTEQQGEEFAEEDQRLLSFDLLGKYLEGRKFQFEGLYENAVGRFFEIVERVESDAAVLDLTRLESIPREKRYLIEEAYDPQYMHRKPEIWFTYSRANRALMDLRQRLRIAIDVYQDAIAADAEGDLEEARALYRDLMIDLPSYRDVFERLRNVEIRLGIVTPLPEETVEGVVGTAEQGEEPVEPSIEPGVTIPSDAFEIIPMNEEGLVEEGAKEGAANSSSSGG